MLSGDRRQSQLQMRYRVAFQLCTVGAVLGGVYYNAYKAQFAADGTPKKPLAPVVDARVFMRDADAFAPAPPPTPEEVAARRSELR